MSSGRGHGRGRGKNSYQKNFPEIGGWITPKRSVAGIKASSSVQSAKDVLLQESYIRNNRTEEVILYIENDDLKWVTDPWEIRERYLQHQSFLPHFDQHRYVYEQILINTGSVEFTHHHVVEGNTHSPIKYSKAIIRKIISPQQWGTTLNQCRTLSSIHDQKYNYWDYQKAFYNAFYYQNPIKGHSWFFKFEPSIGQQNTPTWLLVWWDSFGPQLDILPEKIQKDCKNWISVFQTLPGKKDMHMSKIITKFFILFGIPWIWKWDFSCDIKDRPCLKRIFSYRWWPSADQEVLLKSINDHIKVLVDSKPKVISENPFAQVMEQLKKNFPNLSGIDLMQKTMEVMKEQFLEINQVSDDDQSMASVSDSSEKVLAGESQPCEDEEEEGTLSDYWDSMTDVIVQKLKKGKGKQK